MIDRQSLAADPAAAEGAWIVVLLGAASGVLLAV